MIRLSLAPLLVFSLPCAAVAQATATWTLGAIPQVSIGGNGSSRTEFQHIGGVFRLANGSVAVVNRATNEIRVFDSRGTYRESFGRKGEGPGEFIFIGWSGRFGDTAVLYDGAQRRVTKVLLRDKPTLIGEQPFAVEAPEGESGIAGRVNSGAWLVRANPMPTPDKKPSRYRIPGMIGVANPSLSGRAVWQPVMADGDAFVYLGGGKASEFSLSAVAFGAELVSVASSSAIWFGDGATDSLFRLDPSTGNRTAVHVPAGTPVTAQMIADRRASDVELAKNERDRDIIGARYSSAFLPKRLPAYEALIAGPRGEVWVQRGTPASTSPGDYLVLSAAGAPIARVVTAPGFRVTEVGLAYVAGVHRDDDGVETVRVYSLRRP